jgi:DNA-binding MarR family transcriptional regulator
MLITQLMGRHANTIEDTACAAGVARRASRSLTRLYDHHLAQAGVTTTQFSILRTLQRNGGSMSLADLAADLIFERTSLYRALSPLRRSGLVTMGPAADRRAHRVALTKRATRRINQALPHWAAAQRIVLDRFGAAAWSKLALRLGDLTTIARWGVPR